MAEVTSLKDAIASLVHDGDSVALEGFTHLIPFAAGHEIVRQGRKDLELIRAIRGEVTVPVIASGGAGRTDHFPPAVEAGADAVLAATVFHFGTLRIADVKQSLADAGHPVR